MTGIEPILIGSAATAGTATAAGTAATAGLFGVGGTFSALSTLSTVASIGSTLFGMQAARQESAAEITSTRMNAAQEAENYAKAESKARRDQYIRAGSQIAAAGAQGRGVSGNVLDIMADTVYQNELDILGIRTSAQMTKDLARTKINEVKKSSRLKTGASILTGVTTLAKGGVV